jgi:hypothetical protein
MNRTDSATFGDVRIQLFHSVKMDSIRPLLATFGNGLKGFLYSASSSSIRPKSAKMADEKATWQPWFSRVPEAPVFVNTLVFCLLSSYLVFVFVLPHPFIMTKLAEPVGDHITDGEKEKEKEMKKEKEI